MLDRMILISCIKCSGVEEYIKNCGKNNIRYLPNNDYKYHERVRTKEELQDIKDDWMSKPHLLSGEGYINSIKDNLIIAKNPEYPRNYVDTILSLMDTANQFDNPEILFIDLDSNVIDFLNKARKKVFVILTPENFQDIYIGRAFLNGKQAYVQKYMNSWNLRYVESMIDKYGEDHPERALIFDRNMNFEQLTENAIKARNLLLISTFTIFYINTETEEASSIQFCATNQSQAVGLFYRWVKDDIEKDNKSMSDIVTLYKVMNVEMIYNEEDEKYYEDTEHFYVAPDDYKVIYE